MKKQKLIFRDLVAVLNGLVLVLMIIDGVTLVLGHRIAVFKLMWDLICGAFLIFIDTCQKNVIRKLNAKRVGFFIIDLSIGLSILMIICSLA